MEERGWASSTHGGSKKYITFCSEDVNERGHLRELRVDCRVVFKCVLEKCDLYMETEFCWLMISPNSELL
jgi:hypothetical protein